MTLLRYLTKRNTFVFTLWETIKIWNQKSVPKMAAALSYYTLFSLAPIVIITLGILGTFVNRDTLDHHFIDQIKYLWGDRAGDIFVDIINYQPIKENGILAIITGFTLLAFGATGVFIELKSSLNTIWEVEPPSKNGVLDIIKRYFAPMTMILGIGFLLLVSLVFSAAMAAAMSFIGKQVPGVIALIAAADQVFNIILVTGLFAFMYKVLPDLDLTWKEVWFGAFVAGVLFLVGRTIIGLYLGRATITTAYGPAGSLVAILAWIYYSSQIMFIGAIVSKVHYPSNKLGHKNSEYFPQDSSERR